MQHQGRLTSCVWAKIVTGSKLWHGNLANKTLNIVYCFIQYIYISVRRLRDKIYFDLVKLRAEDTVLMEHWRKLCPYINTQNANHSTLDHIIVDLICLPIFILMVITQFTAFKFCLIKIIILIYKNKTIVKHFIY